VSWSVIEGNITSAPAMSRDTQVKTKTERKKERKKERKRFVGT
jgi:hypothetical protein